MPSLSKNCLCPCDSGKSFVLCCQPYLLGDRLAERAELLMRSRYTAYVRQDEAYLLATWHPDTRPLTLHFDQEPGAKWLGLSVKRAVDIDSQHAEVEFVARYKINGRACRMHEISRFERIDGRWFYLDGVVK
jgi:SEC-C motif domain protein